MTERNEDRKTENKNDLENWEGLTAEKQGLVEKLSHWKAEAEGNWIILQLTN